MSAEWMMLQIPDEIKKLIVYPEVKKPEKEHKEPVRRARVQCTVCGPPIMFPREEMYYKDYVIPSTGKKMRKYFCADHWAKYTPRRPYCDR